MPQKGLPIDCERDAPRVAVKEAHATISLKATDISGEGRLTDPELLGGCSDVALAGYRQEGVYEAKIAEEIHNSPLSILPRNEFYRISPK
jgi:hypothetical protein